MILSKLKSRRILFNRASKMLNREGLPEQLEEPTDWEILRIPEGSSPEEIKTAYRRAVKKVHPDMRGVGSEGAFKQTQEAYERLSGKAKKPEDSIRPASTSSKSAEAARKYKEAQEAWEKETDPFKDYDPDKTDLYG